MSKTGVICKVERNRYFILTESGDFLSRRGTPPAGKSIGDRVAIAPAGRKWIHAAAVVAAALLLVTISSLLPWLEPEPSEYRMTVDINPSIELIYSGDFQLLDWQAYNQEARDLLDGLELPEDLYSALAVIFTRCIDLGIVLDEHDVFVTAVDEIPLDQERLQGAFEGHGAAVRLHVVRLAKEEYHSPSGSPLRSYLNRMAGTHLDDSEPVADAALNYLTSELVVTLEVVPWHNNPIVQAFVEKYLVKGRLVEDMLEDGLSPDEIANLLDLAKSDKITPSDIYKQLKESGLSPGQFVKENTPGNSKAPELSAPDWLMEMLALEFRHSTGQISSYLRKGVAMDELQSLLILESLGSGKLQTLVKRLDADGLDALIRTADSQEYNFRLQHLQGIIAKAEAASDDSEVVDLANKNKVSKAEVLYILGKGYSLGEAREILQNNKNGRSIKDILDDGDGSSEGSKPGNSGNAGKPGNVGKPGQGNN